MPSGAYADRSDAATCVTLARSYVPVPSATTSASYQAPPLYGDSFRLPAPGKPAGTNPTAPSEPGMLNALSVMILSASVAVLPGLSSPSWPWGYRDRKRTPPGP